MDYSDINRSVGKSKYSKIVGWIFLVSGILVLSVTLSSYIEWNLNDNNYNKQYVYSDNGILYYENKNDKTYVEIIYDMNNEVIELDIPDKKTVIMYCSKENMNECIYFDVNNSIVQGILNPFMSIVVSLFLIALGLFCVINRKMYKKNKGEKTYSLNSLYMFYISLFIFGAGILNEQIYQAVNYFNLKNDSNVTTATIYSEIYSVGRENDLYIDGSLEENIGTTFELYYNRNNHNEVSKKQKPVNISMIIIGIGFVVYSAPFVFFKNKMEELIKKYILKKKNKECKI